MMFFHKTIPALSGPNLGLGAQVTELFKEVHGGPLQLTAVELGGGSEPPYLFYSFFPFSPLST